MRRKRTNRSRRRAQSKRKFPNGGGLRDPLHHPPSSTEEWKRHWHHVPRHGHPGSTDSFGEPLNIAENPGFPSKYAEWMPAPNGDLTPGMRTGGRTRPTPRRMARGGRCGGPGQKACGGRKFGHGGRAHNRNMGRSHSVESQLGGGNCVSTDNYGHSQLHYCRCTSDNKEFFGRDACDKCRMSGCQSGMSSYAVGGRPKPIPKRRGGGHSCGPGTGVSCGKKYRSGGNAGCNHYTGKDECMKNNCKWDFNEFACY